MNLRRALIIIVVTMIVMHVIMMFGDKMSGKRNKCVIGGNVKDETKSSWTIYIIKAPEYGDNQLPTSFETYFKQNHIQYSNVYTINTNFLFCRNHVLTNSSFKKVTPYTKLIYGLVSSNNIACKRAIAEALSGTEYIPKTIVLSSDEESRKIQLGEIDTNRKYIFKQNIQQQMGITLAKTPEEVTKNILNVKNVVLQEVLTNPLLVNNRKVNMRIYVLVVFNPHKQFLEKNTFVSSLIGSLKGGVSPTQYEDSNTTKTFSVHMYSNGFMYYTKQFFETKGDDMYTMDNLITTGYIDRQVYKENPLTLYDLLDHLGEIKFNAIFTNITKGINAIFTSVKFKGIHEFESKAQNKTRRFSIFGCDIAPDEDFNVKIMEINKGPDLSGKDERDIKLKTHMVETFMNYILDGRTCKELIPIIQ